MQTALSRRAKRRVYGPTHTCYVDFAAGCADAAAAEVERLARDPIVPAQRDLAVDRPRDLLVLRDADYRRAIELVSRCLVATDIRMIIHQEEVDRVAKLDEALARVPFDLFLSDGDSARLSIDSTASGVYHEGLLREKAENALRVYGITADADDGGGHRLSFSLLHDTLRVAISLAGAPLWKRGYRSRFDAPAPLREDLAQVAVGDSFPAGDAALPFMLLPFAGSGTFLIETAMLVYQLSSSWFGRKFAFEDFRFGVPKSVAYADEKLFLRSDATLRARGAIRATLIDRDETAVSASRANIDSFSQSLGRRGLGPAVEETVVHDDAFATPWRDLVSGESEVFLPLNPPYGHRLSSPDIAGLYRRIGEEIIGLAESCSLSGLCLCPSAEEWRTLRAATDSAGLQSRTRHVGQGGIDVRILSFSSYF